MPTLDYITPKGRNAIVFINVNKIYLILRTLFGNGESIQSFQSGITTDKNTVTLVLMKMYNCHFRQSEQETNSEVAFLPFVKLMLCTVKEENQIAVGETSLASSNNK